MKRIGIYGGSFDPVHYGHLLLAESCREQVPLDEVWWVPNQCSPFKQDQKPAAPSHRRTMLELATGGHDAFRVEPIEIEREGVSYTVETLEELSKRHPAYRWFLLMGSDSLAGFPAWRSPDRILELATLVAVTRPATAVSGNAPSSPTATKLDVPHRRVEMPLVGISSTDLRARVAAGRSIRYQTPSAVEAYIRQHGLYRGAVGDG